LVREVADRTQTRLSSTYTSQHESSITGRMSMVQLPGHAGVRARLLWLFLAGIVAGGIAAGFIFLGGLAELEGQARSPGGTAQSCQLCLDTACTRLAA
jgi:hypothetical protein